MPGGPFCLIDRPPPGSSRPRGHTYDESRVIRGLLSAMAERQSSEVADGCVLLDVRISFARSLVCTKKVLQFIQFYKD